LATVLFTQENVVEPSWSSHRGTDENRNILEYYAVYYIVSQ